MDDGLSAADREDVPQVAVILGGLGLLPFIAGVVLMALGEPAWVVDALRYYAATILAFMGGVHWGLAIGRRGDVRDEAAFRTQLIASVVPSLVAWLALFMPPLPGLAVAALTFALLLIGDLIAARRDWTPVWYPRLRAPLSGIVILCLVIAAWL